MGQLAQAGDFAFGEHGLEGGFVRFGGRFEGERDLAVVELGPGEGFLVQRVTPLGLVEAGLAAAMNVSPGTDFIYISAQQRHLYQVIPFTGSVHSVAATTQTVALQCYSDTEFL